MQGRRQFKMQAPVEHDESRWMGRASSQQEGRNLDRPGRLKEGGGRKTCSRDNSNAEPSYASECLQLRTERSSTPIVHDPPHRELILGPIWRLHNGEVKAFSS